MRNVLNRARTLIVTSLVGAWAVFTYACTGGIENPQLVLDNTSGNSVDPNNVAINPEICAQLGGYVNVQHLADAVFATATQDCRLTPTITQAERFGNDVHLYECFEQFVGSVLQCPDVSFTEGTTKDSKGDVCDSITPGLKLSAMDWQSFGAFGADSSTMSAAESVFRGRGLKGNDIAFIANAFAGKQESVANDEIRSDKYTRCSPSCGGDACDPDAGAPPPPPPPKDSGTTPVDSGSKDTGVADAPTDG